MMAFAPRILGATSAAVLLTAASVLAPTAGAATTAPVAGALHQYGGWYGADTAYGGYGYYTLPATVAPVEGASPPLSTGTPLYDGANYYVPYYGYGSLDYQGRLYPGSGSAAWFRYRVPNGGLAYPYSYPSGPAPEPPITSINSAGTSGGSPQQGR